ncbi:3D (Asp-Asp-Asp) domain-containing protein [Haloferula luteola]|uniref:3D (Asp-Asp-Asp) domain-containing protein n=1 Tax=Haloferula luteola TaxID=595692 RepID=A0A840V695_9BACT|nr:3D domain-containing protein [Haloferula luteola]MBB5353545.1 3D (Asp-Asp-Asp) domain-containing protein [Haloferula luteola]
MRFLIPALAALFLASCGSNIALVSKDRARDGSSYSRNMVGSSVYATANPSASVVKSGLTKPRDKHGMPLYNSERVRYVRTTAYTCSESDHLEYGSMNAAGTPLRYTSQVRSAAADWSVYPVGTKFRIKGMPQLFVVDDYGSALTGTGTIDIYTPTRGHMDAWGCRKVEIAIVQWGSYARSAEILAKRTGFTHCRQMYAAIQGKMNRGYATASR